MHISIVHYFDYKVYLLYHTVLVVELTCIGFAPIMVGYKIKSNAMDQV